MDNDSSSSSQRVSVRILFFAQARERTKLRDSTITFSKDRLKPKEVFETVLRQFEELRPLEQCIILARNKVYLDLDSEEEVTLRPEDELAVIPPISAGSMDIVKLTDEKISVEEISDSVAAEGCGAISLFVGTTRDNFDNKKVIHLEYEAYEPMAIDEMKKICTQVREKWSVENIAFVHRLGVVPVKEASIVIAISSPHRGESLEAVHYAIDELKRLVPIWKKEVYEGENPLWKANPECAWKNDNKPPTEAAETA